jgi:hypothetical protein
MDFAWKTFPRNSIHTEISSLRYASVEMTKGRVVMVRSSGQGKRIQVLAQTFKGLLAPLNPGLKSETWATHSRSSATFSSS